MSHANETDELVQRLKSAGVWVRHSSYAQAEPAGYDRDSAPFEAADTIGMLQREVEVLRAQVEQLRKTTTMNT